MLCLDIWLYVRKNEIYSRKNHECYAFFLPIIGNFIMFYFCWNCGVRNCRYLSMKVNCISHILVCEAKSAVKLHHDAYWNFDLSSIAIFRLSVVVLTLKRKLDLTKKGLWSQSGKLNILVKKVVNNVALN